MKKIGVSAINIFMSGGENTGHLKKMLGAKVESILLSYFYIQQKGIEPAVFQAEYPTKVMVDSGAHTFQWEEEEKRRPLEFYEKYLVDYISWLRAHRDKIFAAVELDIESVVGWDQVKKWQKKYFEPLEKEGMQICYCWHPERGAKGWEEMCRQHKYVGIGDLGYSIGKQLGFARVARKYGAKIHGFAMTKPDILMKVPYYCLSDDHEVLTKTGWKLIQNVKKGEETLIWDNNQSEWSPNEGVFTFDVLNEPLHRFKSRTFDTLCTSNHRWKVKNRQGKFLFKETLELEAHDRIPRADICKSLPTVPVYSDALVELVAWVWTGGSIYTRTTGYSKVSIYQSSTANPEKVKEIERALCEACSGIATDKFYKSTHKYVKEDGSEGVMNHYEISGRTRKQIVNILGKDKLIPLEFVNSLTVKQLKMFIDKSIKADGTVSGRVKDKCFQIAQKDGKNLEVFQIACLLSGIPTTSFMLREGKEKCISSSNVPYIYPYHAKHTVEKYTGKIGCLKTKSGTFFVRRNGKIYVTGNTVDSTRWMTGEQYGCTFIWAKNKMVELYKDNKDDRKRYKRYFRQIGVDFTKLVQEDALTLGIANIKAWIECEKFINKRTLRKQYWLNPQEQEQISKSLGINLENPSEMNTSTPQDTENEQGNAVLSEDIPLTPTPTPPSTAGGNGLAVLTEQDRMEGLDIRRAGSLANRAVLCDNCYASEGCTNFKVGALCAMNGEFTDIEPARNPEEAVKKISQLISITESRTRRALFFEKVDGGYPDKNTTGMVDSLIDYNERYFRLLKEMSKRGDRVTIEGSELLEKIFGIGNRKEAEKIIEEPAETAGIEVEADPEPAER